MADFSLAELILLLQDNAQRSYDYVDDMTEAARDDLQDKVTLSVSELSMILPVTCAVADTEIDLTELQEKDAAASAYQLSEVLLRTPRAHPDLKREMRAHAYADIAASRAGAAAAMSAAQQSEPAPAKASSKTGGSAKKVSRASMAAATKAHRLPVLGGLKAAIKSSSKGGKIKARDVFLSMPDAKSAGDTLALAQLEISFKAALK